MSKNNNNNDNNKKIVETTAKENNEINIDELLDQYDEEVTAETAEANTAEANTEETNVNETQEETNMDNNNTQNNTQVQNTQATTSKKEKVLNGIKTVAKWTAIIGGAGAAGWFGHKYLSKDKDISAPSAEDAFI